MNPWLCNLLFNNSGGSSLPVTGQTFYASLKTSAVPEVGTGGPTLSRATAAWRFNDIGLLRQIPSGCAEFGGARLVVNQVGASEAVNGSAWTKSNCTAGSATTLVCASGTSLQRMYSATAYAFAVGEKWDFCARLTYVDHPYVQIRGHGSVSNGVANFDILNGTYTIAGSADSASMTLVSSGVYDCRVRISITGAATTAAPTFSFVSSTAAAMDATFAGDGVKSFGITRIQSVNVTGRDASYVPEYVSVGSDTNKNFFTYTDDFSQPAWSRTNVTITQAATANPINGLVNAQKVEASSSATTSLSYISGAVGRVGGNIFVVYVKQGSEASDANSFLIRNYTSSTNLVSITLNYSTGNITYLTGSTGASAVDVGGGWWRVTLIVTSGISANDQLRPYIGFVGGSETINEFCYVYRPYLGCGITAPDIIPVVSAAWDAHGTGVDGCKYFATDWQGAPIPASNLTRLRKEPAATNALMWSRNLSQHHSNTYATKRWQVAETSGAELLTNNSFDSGLTGWTTTIGSGGSITATDGQCTFVSDGGTVTTLENSYQLIAGETYVITIIASGSGSVKLGNNTVEITGFGSGTSTISFVAGSTQTFRLTRTSGIACNLVFDSISCKLAGVKTEQTATGLDGIANSASCLTARADNPTILQPTSGIASAARCASTYVRRKTGTGTISFTQDGGSTWTDITSQLNSATYSRVQITATLANPSVGFKISTSGDAIEVDCVQNEAGSVATSPIVTTTTAVTRNAESLTYQTASNWSDTAGTVYVQTTPVVYSGGAVGSATNGLLLSTSNSGATAYDGTNAANGPTGTPGATEKLAVAWGSSAMSVASSGAVGTAGTYDGAMGLSSIGIGVGAVGYFGDVAIYNYKMTDEELQAITT